MDMQGKVEQFMLNQQILSDGISIVAGVSGGADSICLLYILYSLKNKYNINIVVVHLNHGIRGEEAKRDSDFVKVLCESLALPCCFFEEDIPNLSKKEGISLEEAGRKMRYCLFEKVRSELRADYIAVAHHKNDNEETILWNFFRGSGLKGLKGIEFKRDKIIRPLLCVSREEIEQFLLKKKLEWCQDSTNDSITYTRNKIRLEVLPYLKSKIHPKVGDNIIQTGKIAGEIHDYMVCQAKQFIDLYVQMQYNSENCVRADIKLEAFISIHIALQKYIIRILIENIAGKLKDITSHHIEDVVLLTKKGVGKSINLPYNIIAICNYNSLRLFLENELSNNWPISFLQEQDGRALVREYEKKVQISEFFYEKSRQIPKNIYTKWFDYDKIKSKVELRTRKTGDFIQVTASGGTKKLKDYFIDQKIPRQTRDSILLFADGSHIMWIVGYRISEAYKVTDNTQRIMQIKIQNEES